MLPVKKQTVEFLKKNKAFRKRLRRVVTTKKKRGRSMIRRIRRYLERKSKKEEEKITTPNAS